MNVRDVPWNPPLRVTLQSGLQRTFASAYEALDFLENEWPIRQGRRYEGALNSCGRALARSTPASVAREAFIAACVEAGVTVSGDGPQPVLGRELRRDSAH